MNRTKSVLLAVGFVLALAFTLNGCSSDDGNNSNINNTLESGDNCDGEAYTKYQFCADGVVYDFCDGSPYNPSIVACCNNKQYTVSTQFCSGIIIYTKCGGEDYNPDTMFCLNDEIYSKCGGSTYNPAIQFCSNNTAYSKCGGSDYDPDTQRCQSNVIQTECGTGWYNATNANLRCENNVMETKCGTSWYDASNSSLRCQSNVVEIQCGTSWYNSLNYRCGDGNVVEIQCGDSWYDASNWSLDCENNVVKTRCGWAWYDASNSSLRCQSDVVETKCGDSWYNASNSSLRCQSNVVEAQCSIGSGWYEPKYQFCSNYKIYSKCGGNSYDPLTEFCSNNEIGYKIQCGTDWYNPVTENCYDGTSGSVTYDGKTYRYVGIYTQIWMAENLDYDVPNNDTDKCHYDSSYCAKYGRLYNWATALTACPKGWHLPSIEEWRMLTNYTGISGDKLKATSGWDDSNGTDDYGFSALPGGFLDNSYVNINKIGYWWSSTRHDATRAFTMNMSSMFSESAFDETYLLSIRCVRD